jgi:hypothetical protein
LLKKAILTVAVVAIQYLPCQAVAQAPPNLDQILKPIQDTADRICGYVGQSGSRTDEQVQGDGRAGLSGLAKKLTD